MIVKIFPVVFTLLTVETLGRHAERRPFYQARRSWKPKSHSVDFDKDHDTNEQSRFRPRGYKGFLEKMRKEAAMFPPYVNLGLRQESIKDLIQKGTFLNAGFVSSGNSVERKKREEQVKNKTSTAVSIMNEISSVEVLPIIRSSRTIECQREADGIVNCHQDDLHYKIRLKHPDLPQDVLETLISNLYARLFKVTADKKKRDGCKNSPKFLEESPFIVVLPTDRGNSGKAGLGNRPVSKVRSSNDHDQGEDLIIECSPTGFEAFKDRDEKFQEEDAHKSYVYSCKWHGKRSDHQQKIVVEKEMRGPPLQSFEVLIDPSKVGVNLLPITVMHK